MKFFKPFQCRFEYRIWLRNLIWQQPKMASHSANGFGYGKARFGRGLGKDAGNFGVLERDWGYY